MPAEPVRFTFDGRPMTAEAGQTVGAALLAAGVRSWRRTRNGGRGGGAFWGVGACLDGRRMTAEAGQTVGAALLAAGVRSWRRTRNGGRPRGLFCGIGASFDCLVD